MTGYLNAMVIWWDGQFREHSETLFAIYHPEIKHLTDDEAVAYALKRRPTANQVTAYDEYRNPLFNRYINTRG